MFDRTDTLLVRYEDSRYSYTGPTFTGRLVQTTPDGQRDGEVDQEDMRRHFEVKASARNSEPERGFVGWRLVQASSYDMDARTLVKVGKAAEAILAAYGKLNQPLTVGGYFLAMAKALGAKRMIVTKGDEPDRRAVTLDQGATDIETMAAEWQTARVEETVNA